MDLNYSAPINPLGYGNVGVNILSALVEQDVDVKLWPIGQVSCAPHHAPIVKRAIDTRHWYNLSASSLRLWHQFDLAQHVGHGMHIGFPIFELDNFTKQEYRELDGMDMLFVCSQWAKSVIEKRLPHTKSKANVVIVPLGVDRTIFHENIGTPDPQWTTFLNIGKWEYRKGHDVLCEAFSRAFNPQDRVRLWMMNHNPFLSAEQTHAWHRLYKGSRMGHRVSFLNRVDTPDKVAQIMSEADCGVFPARAEGWNLELLEMMSVGKPVITTKVAGHTEFCHENNAILIDVNEREIAHDGVFFVEPVGSWGKFEPKDIDQLVECMRTVHQQRPNNPAGIVTAKQFSWQNTASIIKTHI
jgi:glycosyltransferase involved in cell wall biosynthesis